MQHLQHAILLAAHWALARARVAGREAIFKALDRVKPVATAAALTITLNILSPRALDNEDRAHLSSARLVENAHFCCGTLFCLIAQTMLTAYSRQQFVL